jgi:6-phosphogluconolactonase (cycloisomerase 2 family)
MKSIITTLIVLLSASILYAQAVPCESGRFLYSTTGANPQTVLSYCAQADGSMTPISGSPFSTGGSGAFGGWVSPNRGTISGDGRRMYVTNDGFSSFDFSGFNIDVTTGVLTPIAGSPWPVGDNSVAGSSILLSPDGKFLYLTRNNSRRLVIYSINEETGVPTYLSEVSFLTVPNASPIGAAISPDGKWLAISFFNASTVMVYSIGSDGLLTSVPGSPYNVGSLPSSLFFHPSKQLLYVTTNFNKILVYSVEADGQLTLAQGFTTSGFPPDNIFISPDERFIYGTMSSNGVIQRFSLVTETGLISAMENSYSTFTNTSILLFSKDGTFLYTKGFNAPLTTFTIDQSGDLTLVSSVTGSEGVGINLMINEPTGGDDDDDGECVPGSFSIQIKPPSSGTVPIKLRDNIPVAIMGRCDFDPLDELTLTTARFENAEPQRTRRGTKYEYRDVNGDGFLDVILFFPASQTTLNRFSTSASLSVTTTSNATLTASQSVRILK